MSWFTAFVVYVLVWWTVLFAVLPFGTRPNPEADSVTGWRGAPARPMLGKKVLWTTLISAVVWAAIMAVVLSPFLSFRTGL